MNNFTPSFTCDTHKRYQAIRAPKPGCVICHAMWNERLVWLEHQLKITLRRTVHLPHVSGFEFIGVMHDGTKIPCVRYNAGGSAWGVLSSKTRQPFDCQLLIGWEHPTERVIAFGCCNESDRHGDPCINWCGSKYCAVTIEQGSSSTDGGDHA